MNSTVHVAATQPLGGYWRSVGGSSSRQAPVRARRPNPGAASNRTSKPCQRHLFSTVVHTARLLVVAMVIEVELRFCGRCSWSRAHKLWSCSSQRPHFGGMPSSLFIIIISHISPALRCPHSPRLLPSLLPPEEGSGRGPGSSQKRVASVAPLAPCSTASAVHTPGSPASAPPITSVAPAHPADTTIACTHRRTHATRPSVRSWFEDEWSCQFASALCERLSFPWGSPQTWNLLTWGGVGRWRGGCGEGV